MDSDQSQRYLDRIGYQADVRADADSLERLHLAHLQAVPFENLSIHWRESMALTEAHLYQKIVLDRRGGFCYEANSLFAALLRSLGFTTRLLSARVAGADGTYSSEFDHLAVLVELDEPWLVDVGFGDSFRRPLRLVPSLIQSEQHRAYRLEQEGDEYVLNQSILGRGWEPQYRFSLEPRVITDFQDRFEFHRDSPTSHFRKAPLATVATPAGRKTLSGLNLIHTTLEGERIEQEIAEAAYQHMLESEFGIRRITLGGRSKPKAPSSRCHSMGNAVSQ